jgi:hypothetical protein
MINELISAFIVSLGFIGAIMAMKWKGRNAKPRIQDEELDKFKQSHEKE